MKAYDKATLPIETVLKSGLTTLGYEQAGSLAGTESFKEDQLTRKTMSYHFSVDHIICTHETRLLRTGSRTIQIKRLRSVEQVMDILTQLDNTVVKY